MATTAQIEANRRNAQRSTWPKSDDGKKRARCNALRHGMRALTIMPVLPQEDPKQLQERTDRYTNDLQPGNAAEYDLVVLLARLAHGIERGERIETAHLAGRVREAGREQTQKPSARQRKHVRELGRRLLYITGPETKTFYLPPWDDDPESLVSELEESAEGCRWLLDRWAEYCNLLARKVMWDEAVLLRFIRLQGKNIIESVYDPELNAIFLAWDVLVPKSVTKDWNLFRDDWPMTHPSSNGLLEWRTIADRPSDPAEAWAVLYEIVNQHVGRLKELLARNEAIEAVEDPDWADRAALDCSPEFERHRRYQSAKTRELLRTLETLRKMRNSEFGMRNEEKADDECQVEEGELQVAGGDPKSPIQNPESPRELQVAIEHYEVESGGCDEGQRSEPITEGSFGPVVGHDSNRVIDDSTNDKNGVLSHEGVHAAGQPEEGDGAGQCRPVDVTTPQKAPNEANLESTQMIISHRVESENGEPREPERSHL
jgi:hypothetical protein